MQPTRAVCIREIQNTIKDSIKQLLSDKIQSLGVGEFFQILDSEIRGANGSLIIFRGMQSYNAESIKSLEAYDVAFVEEAQTLSQPSLDMLRPTIRKEGSELWFIWNPASEEDPVDKLFRSGPPPTGSIVREVNWQDNPWFPEVLREEMVYDLNRSPEKHQHVWGGGYQAAPSGSYYGALLATAEAEKRIGRVPHDPGVDVQVAFDLGVGKNMALWFGQWIGREIRIIDFLEGDEQAANEGLPWYGRKMREKSYTYGKLILPHDARSRELGTGKSREETLISLNFKTDIVSKMVPDDRIEMVLRHIPMMYFDSDKCAIGLKYLRQYRENYDAKLRISRGPLHDFNSHAADSIGHMVQAYEAPRTKARTVHRSTHNPSAGSWMGG